jgi:hypothetical protein
MDHIRDSLCAKISERIKVRGYCIVYDGELAQLRRPLTDCRKEQIHAIQRFAAENGLAVTIRDPGLNATFTKTDSMPTARLKRRLKLPRHGRGLLRTI